jgi:hypothetical protein
MGLRTRDERSGDKGFLDILLTKSDFDAPGFIAKKRSRKKNRGHDPIKYV